MENVHFPFLIFNFLTDKHIRHSSCHSAVLNLLLSRAGRDEQALMTTLAGLVVVLMLILQKISELFSLIKSLFAF